MKISTRTKGVLSGLASGLFYGLITLNLLMGIELSLIFAGLAAIMPIAYDDPR